MKKEKLTFDKIDTHWQKHQRKTGCFKYISMGEKRFNINIDNIIDRFISFIIINQYLYRNNQFDELQVFEKKSFNSLMNSIKKEHGLPPSEYIAKKLNIKYQSKSGKSFYDVNHEVNIYDQEGNLHKGIIRISDHEVYIDKWIENSQYDWGISVIICEKPLFINDNDEIEETTDNRIISIYEYCIEANRKNTETLDKIVMAIIENRKVGFSYNSNLIRSFPVLKTNNHLIEKILYAIDEALKKILK